MDTVLRVAGTIGRNRLGPRDFAASRFGNEYLHATQVNGTIFGRCASCTSHVNTRGQVSRIHSIMSSRFSKVSGVLSSLTSSFRVRRDFSGSSTRGITATLGGVNVGLARYYSQISGFNEVALRVGLGGTASLMVGHSRMVQVYSVTTRHSFSPPVMDRINNSVCVIVGRRTSVAVSFNTRRCYTGKDGLYKSTCGCFCSKGKRFVVILSSNVNANNHTTISNTVTSNLVTELVGTNFKCGYSLGVLGSSVLFGSDSRSLTAVSITKVSLCANGIRLCGTNTTPSVLHEGKHAKGTRDTSLPIKVLESVDFSATIVGYHINSVIMVLSSNTADRNYS